MIIIGLGIPLLLEAILRLMPLDTYVTCPVILLSQAQLVVLIRSILVGNFLKSLNYWVFANLHSQAAVMELVDSDKMRGLAVPVWDEYKQLLSQAGSQVNQHIWKWCDPKTNKADLIIWMFTEFSRAGRKVRLLWTSQEGLCCCSHRVSLSSIIIRHQSFST